MRSYSPGSPRRVGAAVCVPSCHVSHARIITAPSQSLGTSSMAAASDEKMEFETSEDVEVVGSFDTMGFRDELLRGIYAFGARRPPERLRRAPCARCASALSRGRLTRRLREAVGDPAACDNAHSQGAARARGPLRALPPRGLHRAHHVPPITGGRGGTRSPRRSRGRARRPSSARARSSASTPPSARRRCLPSRRRASSPSSHRR